MKTTLLSVLIAALSFFYCKQTTAQEIFGMTKYGGNYSKGVIFKLDETGSNYEVVYSFKDIKIPSGGLTETAEGVFYGFEGDGIIRFNAGERKFEEVAAFDEQLTGAEGVGRMILASDGLMYGMTVSGGEFDMGTLIKFNPDTEEVSKIIDFDGTNKGSHPKNSLIESSDGLIYGMTSDGGVNDSGTIFSFNPSTGEFNKIFDFIGGGNGSNPQGSLTEASDGMLYGMVPEGGVNDFGFIFQIDPVAQEFTILFEFNGEASGQNPKGSLTRAANGKLYGLTSKGGAYDYGTLFEYDPGVQEFNKKVDFIPSADIGIQHNGMLLAHPNGKLYGLVQDMGHEVNLLYEYDPVSDIFDRLSVGVAGARNSTAHERSMTLSSNGQVYFCISGSIDGIIPIKYLNEYDPAVNDITDYYTISGSKTGNLPYGNLAQGSDGMLYGTTSAGGEYEKGVVFKFNPLTYEYNVVHSFNGENGSTPHAGLIGANNAKLYGMTPEGGEFDKGVLYAIDQPSGAYEKIVDFEGINGQYPSGDLVKAVNGILYGTTSTGGENDDGVLFELNPASETFTKRIDFDGEQVGENPYHNSLVAVPGGNIFGAISPGTTGDNVKLFEFNTQENILNIVVDFDTASTVFSLASLALASDNYLVNLDFKFNLEDCSYTWSGFSGKPLFHLSGRLMQASSGKLYGMSVGLVEPTHSPSIGELFEVDLETGDFRSIEGFSNHNGCIPENASLIQLKEFTAPVAQCKDTALYLDETGQVKLNPEDLDNGSTGDGIELALSKTDFYCDDAGEQNITLTVTDENGNFATCSAVVTVTDTIPPVVECQNIELFLDAGGRAEIDASQIDIGSSDGCGISKIELNVDSFGCQDMGENTVVLTVTDINGNASACNATVTVIDDTTPEIICSPDFSAYLDPYQGIFVVDDEMLTTEATDNCGVDSLVYLVNGEKIFTGTSSVVLELEAGVHTVDREVTDGSENLSGCSTVITIEKRPTSILFLDKKIDYDEQEIQIQAVLIDDLLVEGIEGKTLEFALNEESVTAVTDANGTVTVFLPFDSAQATSDTVSAFMEEDDTYLGSTADAEIITGTHTALPGNILVYPNPFTEQVYFEFTSPETADARIDMFDAAGRLVKTIFNRPVEAGMFYKAEFKAEEGTDGYYIYKLKVGTFHNSGIIVSFHE